MVLWDFSLLQSKHSSDSTIRIPCALKQRERGWSILVVSAWKQTQYVDGPMRVLCALKQTQHGPIRMLSASKQGQQWWYYQNSAWMVVSEFCQQRSIGGPIRVLSVIKPTQYGWSFGSSVCYKQTQHGWSFQDSIWFKSNTAMMVLSEFFLL